ncbi:MAG: PfaD family polyunsaturated fatty acid/polyketide biosynthesis protein [Candidatus Bruticola sp.]
MANSCIKVTGSWAPQTAAKHSDPVAVLRNLKTPVFAVASPSVWKDQELPFTLFGDGICQFPASTTAGSLPLLALAPALPPHELGQESFRRTYALRYACLSGSMANAIASENLVEAMARAGMMGFFGSAGLSLEEAEAHIHSLKQKLGHLPHGFNLIHSPSDQQLEQKTAQLFIDKGVDCIEASAFLGLTPALLHYRYSGLRRLPDGTVFTPHHIFAKVSRLEVAAKLLSPPPPEMISALAEQGLLTREEAEMAHLLPPASAITAEADSGGHTDNRPAFGLLPSMLDLRDRMQEKWGWQVPVGAAGGIATPQAAAAAFAMGAAYVMTGSINQACQESGSSPVVREMLSKASPADIAMAPAADMFEMGVNVQVLKWGTMFPVRAKRLYEVYRAYNSFSEVPASVRDQIEKTMLRSDFDQAWQSTKSFFAKRDPRQITKAELDPKHKMALVFRSYLGQASRWANAGLPDRRADYQIWCGPAMGSFNEWCKGTFMENVKERHADLAALNIMVGACILTRASLLCNQGIELPAQWKRFQPLPFQELASLLQESL